MNALILAAGRASRMGVPKVLLPAGRGHTLLSRVLLTALNSVDGQVVVVLGRDGELGRSEVERFLREHPQYQTRVTSLENPHYQEGLSTSLRCGVQEVLRREPTSGVAVFLADQPAFSPSQARDLVRAFRARRADTVAVVAAENGEQRNPVIVSSELLNELLDVEGDRGARGVLKKHARRVEKLELGSGPWFVDADDWTTYAALMRERGWLEEVDVPEFLGGLSEGMIGAITAALSRDPAPLLAPDVLLVGSEDVTWPVRLSQPAMSALSEEVAVPKHTGTDCHFSRRRATQTEVLATPKVSAKLAGFHSLKCVLVTQFSAYEVSRREGNIVLQSDRVASHRFAHSDQMLPAKGIRTVILGRSGSPEDYAHLLRRAALWTLQRSPS